MVRNGNLRLFGKYVRRLGQAWILLQIQLGNIVLGLLHLLHRLVDDWKLLVCGAPILREHFPPCTDSFET